MTRFSRKLRHSREPEQELRDFHRRIGSNLSLIEPKRESPDVRRDARASKERAHDKLRRVRQIHLVAAALPHATPSDRHPAVRPDREVPLSQARFENHPTSDAESHDSASREITVKKSSSRWADRPVPVLQVEFPDPWRILAEFAEKSEMVGAVGFEPTTFSSQAGALPGCATPRSSVLFMLHAVGAGRSLGQRVNAVELRPGKPGCATPRCLPYLFRLPAVNHTSFWFTACPAP